MQGSRRRVGSVAEPVGESRMKVDEGKGEKNSEGGNGMKYYSRLKRNQGSGVSEKRKTWKNEPAVGVFERSPIQIRKTKSDSHRYNKGNSLSVDGVEKSPVQLNKSRSDSHTKQLVLFKEKVSLNNVAEMKGESERVVDDIDDGVDGDEEDDEMGEEDIVMELEEKRIDVKEIDMPKEQPKKVVNEEKTIPIASNEVKKTVQITEEPVVHMDFTKTSPISDEFERYHPETHSKLQNIVDLVMWRDVSKSTLVFGFGTFVLLSSSFTKDLNFSLISAISYMALLYLAAIFFYKSILRRGHVDIEEPNETCFIGEEEAVWLLELILPYLNEFFLKLRSLFSGDPATTMKLAVLLFLLARCGSSITIWKLTKLGFFGVFTLPKVCSSYSTQLNGYVKFWIRRFRDAWDTCSHKKPVAAAAFTLVWNLSSITARIWAAFMLIVAIRYYQQCMLQDQWDEEVEAKEKKGS